MRNILITVITAMTFMTANAQWTPDAPTEGYYRNPIIYSDYSDPDVVRTGDDYWMVASSFAHFPGIPVLHSTDLIHWEIVNHVYDRLPLGKYDDPAHGEGSWAPAIRFQAGKYYVYFCTPNDGLFVATADDPRGKWELRQMLKVVKWEDPCPFWDDDGSAYLVHSIHRGGPAILHRMSPDGMRLLDNGVTVYHDTVANPVLEGLKMYKRDGMYYIFAPAGGVENGWQTVLRSQNIYGPYEARKVLESGDSGINGPHQGALVDTPDGKEWWFIHFQSKGAWGRVTHLQPARWTSDGWIVAGTDDDGDGTGTPVTVWRKPVLTADSRGVVPQTSDDFESVTPGLQWQWQAHPRDEWFSLSERRGFMRLRAVPCPSEQGNLYYAGNLYLQKFPAPSFTSTTVVETTLSAPGERAGLITMGNEYSYIAVIEGDSPGARRVAVVTGKKDKYAVTPVEHESAGIGTGRVWLRATVSDDSTCRYSYSLDGEIFVPIGGSFDIVPGTWVGAKTGIFCSSPNVVATDGYADFDYFEMKGKR